MIAIDKLTKDFKTGVESGDIIIVKNVSEGEPFDSVLQEEVNGKRNLILFKQVDINENVSDDQILSFISKPKWYKMVNQNVIKEQYLEYLESKKVI